MGKRHHIPIIVDAAGQVYPVENMRKYTAMNADLVCYGAKYSGAPNSTGILCGRADWGEAAALYDFIAFKSSSYRALDSLETRQAGDPRRCHRPPRVDDVDHQARFEGYERRARALQDELEGVPNIEATPQGSPVTGLRIALDEKALGKNAAEIADVLREGAPSIWVRSQEDAIIPSVVTIRDGDEVVIAHRLKRLLAG